MSGGVIGGLIGQSCCASSAEIVSEANTATFGNKGNAASQASSITFAEKQSAGSVETVVTFGK